MSENERNEQISDALDIEFESNKIIPIKTKEIAKVEDPSVDISNDYVESRKNYYDLIEKGQEAIDGILDFAKESEHPRAYEVAAQLIKNVSEVNTQLIDLQKKMQDLRDSKSIPNNVTNAIENAVFVGSTNELQKLIKGNKNESNSTDRD
jgi:methylmalonyl-CoA mutase N-terminal domain/subunit